MQANSLESKSPAPPVIDQTSSGWVYNAARLCKGYYQHPSWQDVPLAPRWEISADEIELMSEGKSKLIGRVSIDYGQRQFSADHVEIYREDKQLKTVLANQSVVYADPDLKVFGTEAVWQNQADLMTLKNPVYFFYPRHARGSADVVELQGRKRLIFNKGNYTTCAPGENSWMIEGDEMNLNRETGLGSAKHIQFKIKDQTVFYWPYIKFPIDNKRHSGFLFPHFGNTTQSGVELSAPYYWNIAPQYDATITPKILTERGLELKNEFRYLTRNSHGELYFNILPNDRKYENFRQVNLQAPPMNLPVYDPRITGLIGGTNRIGIHYQHAAHWSRAWNFNVDISHVSDDNYFYDLENDLNSASTTKLNQEFFLEYKSLHWQHQWRAQMFQLLHPLLGPVDQEDYSRLPQWAFQGYYPNIAKHLDANLDGELVYFTQPTDPYTGLNLTQGGRVYLRPGLSMPFENDWSYFTPRVQLDFLSYHLSLSTQDQLLSNPQNPARAIPMVDVDTGLYFDKIYKNQSIQTIEPRLYYLYVPFKNQNAYPIFDSGLVDFSFYKMFRDNRFSGHDRLGDTNQLTLALTSRRLNAQKEEKMRFTVGQILYFKERLVTICDDNDPQCLSSIASGNPNPNRFVSPFIADFLYTPSTPWYFSTGIEINPSVQKGYVGAQYAPSDDKVLNLNYYWMRRDPMQDLLYLVDVPINQIDASFYWPINSKWDALGQYRYDFEKMQTIEFLGGIEYNACCYAWQLVANRYLRPSDGMSAPLYANGVFFQVLFKGLSTFGSTSADHKLKTAIPHYPAFTNKAKF